MPNGLFVSYKRGRRRRQKGDLAWRGRSAAEPISELLSLSLCSCSFPAFPAPSLLLQGFEEARAVRGTPRVRPAAPSTCFPSCASRHTGIGICSPPCSLSLVSISCPTVGCNILLCYLFAFKSTYSLLFLSVSFSVRVLCVEGPCPCVILGSV